MYNKHPFKSEWGWGKGKIHNGKHLQGAYSTLKGKRWYRKAMVAPGLVLSLFPQSGIETPLHFSPLQLKQTK